MALRDRIASNDCIDQYEKSALEHQNAGFDLLAGGSALGVGLMALSVEMLLKAAYFRLAGYLPTQPIGTTDLTQAKRDIRGLGVTRSAEGYHSLMFWAEGIVAVKGQGLPGRTQGSVESDVRTYPAVAVKALKSTEEKELLQRAARLETNWSIGDRYRAVQPHAIKQDLEDVLDDAVGIAELYQQGRL